MSGDIMRVYVTESRYEDDANHGIIVTDVPAVPFLNCRNPLYIGVREGQLARMKKHIASEKLDGTAIGYWELNPTYLTKKGRFNLEQLNKHDVIFLSAPSRAHESNKDLYMSLIEQLKLLLC